MATIAPFFAVLLDINGMRHGVKKGVIEILAKLPSSSALFGLDLLQYFSS